MTSSISSLRLYAQSRGYLSTSSSTSSPLKAKTTAVTAPLRPKASVIKLNADLLGQQIAPWHTLIQGLSPVKEKANTSIAAVSTPPLSSDTFKQVISGPWRMLRSLNLNPYSNRLNLQGCGLQSRLHLVLQPPLQRFERLDLGQGSRSMSRRVLTYQHITYWIRLAVDLPLVPPGVP